MVSTSIDRFRESIPVVQGQLGDLKEKLQEVLAVINSGKLVSDAMADSVAESLKTCREKEAELRSLASELDIVLEDQSFDQMAELADRVEKEMSLEGLRQVVFDYFRLTTTAQDTLDALEESKKKLQKVCRLIGDEFSAAFEPYSRLVEHTKSQEDLTDEDYDLISNKLGTKMVRAADKRKFSIDDSADISSWLDGSADLLRERKPVVETVPIRDVESPVQAEMTAKVPVEETVEAETAADVPENEAPKLVEVPVEEPVEAVESVDESADVEEVLATPAQESVLEENDPSLLGYVDTVHGKVAVRFVKDTAASEARPSKFMSKAKNSATGVALAVTLPYLMTMHLLSVKKLGTSFDGRGKLFGEDVKYLLNHGYLGLLTFNVNGEEQEYYVPSSKAYACLRRESVASYLKSKMSKKGRFPDPFDLIAVKDWSPLFAYRCKMIADYFDAYAPDIIYNICRGNPLHEYAYCGYSEDDDEVVFYGSDRVFDDAGETMPFIARYTRESDGMNIIVEDLDSIQAFCDKFSPEDADVKVNLKFVMASDPDHFYDMNGDSYDIAVFDTDEFDASDLDDLDLDESDDVDGDTGPTQVENVMLHPIKQIPKLKDPSNARFDDVLKTTDNLFKYLLEEMTFLGFMDEKHIIKEMEELYDYSANKTIELLNYLENKGYLCTYEYNGRNILCFTELMWSCLYKESLKNLILRRFPEMESVRPAILYGAQDMPKDQFVEHLKMVDQYILFMDKLKRDSAFVSILPTSRWNSREKRYEIVYPYTNSETGEKKKSNLVLLSAEEYKAKKVLPGDTLICYSPELPLLDEIVEDAFYVCLTDDGLYFMDNDEKKWEIWAAFNEKSVSSDEVASNDDDINDLEDSISGNSIPPPGHGAYVESVEPVEEPRLKPVTVSDEKEELKQAETPVCEFSVEQVSAEPEPPVSERTNSNEISAPTVTAKDTSPQTPEIKKGKSKKEREKEVDEYLKDPNHLYLDDLAESESAAEVLSVLDDGLTAAEMAEKILENAAGGGAPEDEEMFRLIRKLLSEGVRDRDPEHHVDQVVEAVALARMLSGNERYPLCTDAFRQLQAALPVFRDNQGHSGLNLVSVFTNENAISSAAKLCAYLYGMLFPSNAHDFVFASLYKTAFDEYEAHFPDFGAVKHLYHKAMKCLEKVPSGFSPANLSALADSKAQQERMHRIAKEAKNLQPCPSVNTTIKGVQDLAELCFGAQSDLRAALDVVVLNDLSLRELVETNYLQFCAEEGEFDEDRLESYLDEQWLKAHSKYKHTMALKYDARKHVLNGLYERYEVLKEWLDETESTVGPDIEKLRTARVELLQEIDKAIEGLSSVKEKDQYHLVLASLEHIRAKLQNQLPPEGYFTTMLRSGCFILENRELVLNEELNEIRFAEPWRFMLRHIGSTEYNLKNVYRNILEADSKSFLYDNYFQLKQIGKLIDAKPEEYELSPEIRKRAIISANNESRMFREKLEISYAYNRISENDRERLAALVDEESDVCAFFYEHQAFGCWRAFLDALRLQIRDASLHRSWEVRRLLDQARERLRENESADLLDEAEKQIAEKQNFALAEEYINRFNNGERGLPFESSDSLKNYYLDFISDDVFNDLYSYCEKRKDLTMAKIGASYLESNRPEGWTVRHFDDARQLLQKWPSGNAGDTNVPAFIQSLGFVVENSNRYKRGKDVCFTLTLKRTEKNKSDYRHPIAKFGTQLPRQMEVLCLFGKRTATQLIDEACKLDFKDFFIVLLDSTLPLADRRRMAEYFFTHKNVGQSSFIVIDRLLALYLALQPDSERLPALLQCTLPYTIYQPFTNGSGSINDEMFFGRVSELASIRDMSGTSVVYGGRQLGKSALLERVEHLDNKPSKKEYVVRTSIGGVRGEKAFVEDLITACNDVFNGFTVKACEKIPEFVSQLKRFIKEDKIYTLKLLMDESDDFLDSISGNNYLELQSLIDFQRNSDNRFKFVFAGLHNVSRAKNATKNNGLFGQLGAPVCIKPLTPMDARKLLVRPLRYLGFRITNESQIDTILANTNYYPGIIQFFGYKLVQTLSSQYTQKYNAAKGNPPFDLHDDQLADIMNSENLNSEIKKRLRLTLEMDDRYYMLARCITMLYHLNNNDFAVISEGFDISSIREIAEFFDIHCLMVLDTQQLTVLLDEMIEMGILSKPNARENKYLLRRRNFIDTIGPKLDELEREIEENNKEVPAV